MANAEKTQTQKTDAVEPETVETTDTAETTDAAPKKLGRPTNRIPGGKQLSAYFEPAEVALIEEAGFVKRHRKDSDLIRAAVLAYIADVELPASE
jgi:hypothetical protein